MISKFPTAKDNAAFSVCCKHICTPSDWQRKGCILHLFLQALMSDLSTYVCNALAKGAYICCHQAVTPWPDDGDISTLPHVDLCDCLHWISLGKVHDYNL